MRRNPVNAQYNVAAPRSLAANVALSARRQMFAAYCRAFPPVKGERILDVGATSDRSYESSNYFEAWYPFKTQITAVGIDDAAFLEEIYPGVQFIRADALELPFPDQSFDVVHSSAVIEHVGNGERQQKMLLELCRVARRGVFLTTPNRWFPVEFHTVLPFVHWLPAPLFRRVVRRLRGEFFASEANLNLMEYSSLVDCCRQVADFRWEIGFHRLWGWPSNLLVSLRREGSR